MRRSALLAAVVGTLVASNSFAAFTFNTQRTALTGTSAGLDRVVLYALGSGTFGDVFAGDMTISTPTANGLKFTDFKLQYHEGALEGVAPTHARRPVQLPNDYDAVIRAIEQDALV